MIVLHRVFVGSLSLIVTITFWFSSPVWAASNENTLDIFNSGLDQIRQQNYQQALPDFTQVIDRQDNLLGAAYSNRCLVNLQLENYSAAEADCNNAIQYNSDNVEAYLNLGLAYYRQQKYPQAIAQYQQVIQRDHHDYRGYYNRGLAHFDLEDYQSAIADYNLALKSSQLINTEQKSLIYNDLALSYMTLKNYDRAVVNFDRAIALASDNYNAYFNRGCAYHRQKNYLAAIDDFTQVVQLEPNLTQAYVNRAVLHHHIGRDHAAFADINMALKQYHNQGDRLAYDSVLSLKQKLFYFQSIQLAYQVETASFN